jgi:glucan phosphoethanolaminetransferase (alkaline phosphatase superfamily)
LNDYDHNLIAVDYLLGTIIRSIQKDPNNKNTYLIVSSDHWLRDFSATGNPDRTLEPHRIPFIVKSFNEDIERRVEKPFNTVHTIELIQSIFDGTIKTHSDIYSWMTQQPFIETWYPPLDYPY